MRRKYTKNTPAIKTNENPVKKGKMNGFNINNPWNPDCAKDQHHRRQIGTTALFWLGEEFIILRSETDRVVTMTSGRRHKYLRRQR